MLKVSMNICGTTGPYNIVPMSWIFTDSREFTDFIREYFYDILNWSHESWNQINQTKLGIKIIESVDGITGHWEWEFIVKCKNIREFKPYKEMSREEFHQTGIALKRKEKIKSILDYE